MTDRMTPEAEKVLETIQKLLNLAAKAGTPEEAATAAAKAQDMMLKHGLSTAQLERNAGGSGRRTQDKVEGGFYRYQREVWTEVAKLNFCLHWVQRYRTEAAEIRRRRPAWARDDGGPTTEKVLDSIVKRRHVLVGRQVNVRTTIAVANYLLAAVERVTRETCEEKRIGHLSKWAMSFREGCAYHLTSELWRKRRDAIAAEEEANRAAWARATKAGVSLDTALTISTLARREADENLDFANGEEPGTAARERAERAAERRRAEEEYTQWAAANPEEARAKAEAEAAAVKKRLGRGGGGDDRYSGVDRQAFWEGAERAKKIGLDPQTDHGARNARRLT